MNKTSDSGTYADPAFLEYHFYKGGLRIEAFSVSDLRPSWAPPAEWVGFRDEFTLDPEDRVLEIVKFEGNCGPIAWIGIYEAAPDQVYGDRKNHAGIGVWLLGRYPHEPSLLVDALRSLLDLARKDDGTRLPLQGKTFLSNYLKDYVADYIMLPRPLGGLEHATNQIVSTLVWQLNVSDNKFEKDLDDLFHRIFFVLPEQDAKNSRALILLSSRKDSRNFSENNQKFNELSLDIIKNISAAFSEQNQIISDMKENLRVELKNLEDMDFKFDQINSELNYNISRAEEAELQLKNLHVILEDDDGRRQFSILQSSISDVMNSIMQIDRKLSNLQKDITIEIKRELISLNQVKNINIPKDQFRQEGFRQNQKYYDKKRSSYFNSTAFFVFFLVFLLIIIMFFSAYIWL
ncbi:hypothetical protein MCEREM21A_00959 [Sphingomonadaceae bacterium]|jgi:hypothetical protein